MARSFVTWSLLCKLLHYEALPKRCPRFDPQPKCVPRAYSIWPTAMVWDCVVYRPPKTGLRFCVPGCFSLPFPIVFDVLRENKDESRRKTVFLLQILSEMPRLILRC